MKLKGQISKKLSKEKRQKMNKTLKHMEDVRVKDEVYLRNKLNEELKWLEAEYQKGAQSVKYLKEKINTLNIQLLKIEGAIITVKKLQGPENKKE